MKNGKIGILGGGQLATMLAEAAEKIGVDVKIVDEKENCSASSILGFESISFSDEVKISNFFDDVSVVTYEFENIPLSLLTKLSNQKKIYPPLKALEVSGHRGREKKYVNDLGIETAAFTLAGSFTDLFAQKNNLKFPLIIKTCSEGYDGKGQWRVKSIDELEAVASKSGNESFDIVAEEMVDFDYEVSCIAARGTDGALKFYPPCKNKHDSGILFSTTVPNSDVPKSIADSVENATQKILESLDYVGVIAVEYFVKGSSIIFNEFAPRVHNSGHWSIEGAESSQFENHIRACLSLPLGSSKLVGYSLMMNLLGTQGRKKEIESNSKLHYHWYNKSGLGDRRKVGHVTAVLDTETERDEMIDVLSPLVK